MGKVNPKRPSNVSPCHGLERRSSLEDAATNVAKRHATGFARRLDFDQSTHVPIALGMRKWLVLCLLVLCLSAGPGLASQLSAQEYDPEHPVVLEMVKKGVDYLAGDDPDGYDAYQNGTDILSALAIHKAAPEIPLSTPRLRKGLEKSLEIADRFSKDAYYWSHESMYSIPVAGMLLCTIDAQEYSPQIQIIRDQLIAAQRPNGGFGYMQDGTYKEAGQGDISQTQYVTLCLWTMYQADFQIPEDALVRCMQFLESAQQQSGGWGYQYPSLGSDSSVTNSRTAAGFSSFLIAGDTLGVFRSRYEEAQAEEGIVPRAFKRIDTSRRGKIANSVNRDQIEAVVDRGVSWFAAHPYQRSTWHYYYVYSQERYESFLEVTKGKKIKSPDWYNAGVEELLKKQNTNGSWGTMPGDVDTSLGPDCSTSFALLFLIRSTQRAIGEMHDDVLLGGQGLPADPTAVVVKNGRIMDRTVASSIEDALKMFDEDSSAAERANALLPDQISIPTDPAERKEQLRRFSRLMNSRDVNARRFAARLLGRGDDLDFVPSLIYGLSDPDMMVARYSEASLRIIARQLDTYHLPREGDVDLNQKHNAMLRWREWYSSVRPDHIFVD